MERKDNIFLLLIFLMFLFALSVDIKLNLHKIEHNKTQQNEATR